MKRHVWQGWVLVALLSAGCEEASSRYESGASFEMVGFLERDVGATDGRTWLGQETIRYYNGEQQLVCEESFDVDALQAPNGACSGCELTLDVVRSALQEFSELCEVDDVVEVSTLEPAQFVRFVISRDQGEAETGRILVSDEIEGPWRSYAHGVRSDDLIVYSKSQYVGGGDREISGDPLDQLHGPYEAPFSPYP